MSKEKKTTRRKFKWGLSMPATVVLLAFIVGIILCATKYYDIEMTRRRLEAEKAQLEAQKAALIDRNNNILAQGVAGQDSVYIEDTARSQLDMVYPGEIIFRTTGD